VTFFRDREQHSFESTGRESKLGRWAPTGQLVVPRGQGVSAVSFSAGKEHGVCIGKLIYRF
jgi:hypothetical protein